MKRLTEKLLNLLNNAVKFTDTGSVTFSVTKVNNNKEGTTPHDTILFEVKDTGLGIPSNMLDNIFIPYFTTKSKGTGLGLAMSKQMIENMKGSLLRWMVNNSRLFQ